jgi:short-subunit dehydrogenase
MAGNQKKSRVISSKDTVIELHNPKNAIIIGNSDGIGLALTRELLNTGWIVKGFSRSPSPITHNRYSHTVISVDDAGFSPTLKSTVADSPANLCAYCAGIGEMLDLSDMGCEAKIFEVNLLGMVKTVSCIIPEMIRAGKGHFIGLSSLADRILAPDSPSYSASKAGFSCYLESLALAVRPRGVYITNVCFGFVDTKMAKGTTMPFMMSTGKAVNHLMKCIEKRPIRYSAPFAMIPVAKILGLVNRLRTMH